MLAKFPNLTVLKERAASAIALNVAFGTLNDVVQFGVTIILARILTATEYGQFSLVSAFIGFMHVFCFRYVIAHVLQVRDEKDVDYQTQFTAGIFHQGALFIIVNLLALSMHYFENYASIAPLAHVMSLLFVLDLPSEIRNKMLERDLRWERLRVLSGLGVVAGAVVGISVGLAGGRVYALVIPPLIISLPIIYDLLVTSGWRPTLAWNRHLYTRAVRFGVTRSISGLLVSGRQLAESALLVHFVGYRMLGVYGRAVGFAQLFAFRLAWLVMSSLYPIMTRLSSESQEYAKAINLVLRSVAWVIIPIAIVVTVSRNPLVEIVYGPRWPGVAPLLPFAMLASVLYAFNHLGYMTLLNSGRERICALLDVCSLAGTVLLVLIVTKIGLQMYLAGLGLLQAMLVVTTMKVLCARSVLTWPVVLESVGRPLLSAGLAWGLAYAFFSLLGLQVNSIATVVIYAGIYLALFSVISMVLFGRDIRELIGYLRPLFARVRKNSI